MQSPALEADLRSVVYSQAVAAGGNASYAAMQEKYLTVSAHPNLVTPLSTARLTQFCRLNAAVFLCTCRWYKSSTL